MVRTQRNYTDEQVAELQKIVAKHNEGKVFANGYYIIDLTGEKQVYFTLYKYTPVTVGYANPYRYIKNISIDLHQAIGDINMLPLPVIVNYVDNNNPLLVGFRRRTKEGIPTIPVGKYRGETIAEVWDTDRNWVMWFYKNYKTESDYPLNAEEVILKAQAKELIDLFWQQMTERNREESISNYLGTLGMRMTVRAKVTKIKAYPEYGYTKIYLETIDLLNNGNIIYIYDKDYKLQVGDIIKITGTPTKHEEKLGKKQTYLNRINFVKEGTAVLAEGGDIDTYIILSNR